MGINDKCFDCGVDLSADTRSKDTVDDYPICVECSDKRWQEFMSERESGHEFFTE